MQSLIEGFKNIWDFLLEVYQDFVRDNGSLVAAAVSFYIFLSLIPMLLLAIAVLGWVLGSPDRAQQIVFGYLNDVAPALSQTAGTGIRETVEEVVSGREAATGVGLLIFFWTGLTAITRLQIALNVAWDVKVHRSFIKQRGVALLLLILLAMLLGVSFLVTTAFKAISSLDIRVFGISPGDIPFIWSFLSYVVPLFATITAFIIIYRIAPNTKVRFRVAALGGVLAGILWEMSKHVFSYYVSNFANYSRVYGSLAAVILLLIWINYSAVVTILGAEVAAVWGRRHPSRDQEHVK